MALRIIFMGTPDFAVPALEALARSRHEIVGVYTQPPRPAGRGMAVQKSPIHRLAEGQKIPVFTPANFKSKGDIEAFKNLKADLAVVAAYGLLLPEEILTAPKMGCINIHASLLPRWRGAAPIAYAILNGDKKSGLSFMVMDKGLDTGPVLKTEEVTLDVNETAATLHDKLAKLSGKTIAGVIADFAAGKLKPRPQDDSKATIAPKIKKADAEIDWQNPAGDIERRVRAFSPWPGAFFNLGGKRIRVLEGKRETGQGKPGIVLDQGFLVATGKGAFRISRVQMEGKRPMTSDEFLRGHAVPIGTRLG